MATTTAVSGDIWMLQGDTAFLYGATASYAKLLPSPLTINGIPTGSMLTLNNGAGNYGYFTPQGATALTVTLSNLIITGSSGFSAFHNNTGSTTLDTSGVTFSGNNGVNGGAIYSVGNITLMGGETFIGNSSGATLGYGGAVFSNAALTFVDSSQTLTVRNNTAPSTTPSSGGGGGLNAAGNITIPGSAVFDQNMAAGSNGGAIRSVNGNIDVATFAGSDVIVTANRATAMAIAGGGGFFAGAATSTITVGNATGTVQIGGASTADGNSALNGGGIYSMGNAVINGGSIMIANNKTLGGRGAGIYTVGNLTLNASGPAMISGNVAVDTRGGGFYAGGNFTLNAGGDVTFTRNKEGSKANAVYLSNTGGGKTATLNASAGRVITFYDPIESLASNGLVNVVSSGAGLVSFDGSQAGNATDRWSQVYANTQVTAGIFEVANEARYGVRATSVGQTADSVFVTVAGTQLQGGVAGMVDADQVTLAGTLNIAGDQPATRGVFTFNSKNVVVGGEVQFNTELNDATVQNTDLLVINAASTSGSATVRIINVGGLGAATVGNGIQIIQINGTTSNAATFTLASPVYAGNYQYFLRKVGNHWYLQSELMPTLRLTKTASPGSYTAGSMVTYTITATNEGATALSNVTISDPVPAGIVSFNWTCAGPACPNSSGSGALNETILSLLSGASVTYTITATVVSASPPAQIDNVATASAGGMLCAPGNTPAPCSASAPLPAVPVVQITKTANTALLVPGATVTYIVTVANTGTLPAGNVVVADAMPVGVTSFDWVCAGADCPSPGGTGSINQIIATLPAGASVTYTITAVISTLPPAQVNNVATASASGMLCAPGNTASPCSASAPLPAVPVIQLRKTTEATTIVAGGTITYTVTVTNTSASAATNVRINDPIPAGLVASSFGWACNGTACLNSSGSGELDETLPSLPGGASVTYTITAMVASPTAPAQINNVATATSSGALCAPGNTASPCSGSAPLPAAPVLQIAKTADVTQAVPGGTVTYTVTVSNTGAATASNVVVSDPLPTGLSAFDWVCTGIGVACPNVSGSAALNETIASLPGGASMTYTITATVAATSLPAQIDNIATATLAGALCAPANTPSPCSANVLLPVPPLVQLSKAVNTATVVPGGVLTYTITVANTGGGVANDVEVRDTIPAGIVSFNWICTGTGVACPNGSGSGSLDETISALAAGDSVTYTITATVDTASPPAQISNVATVSSPSSNMLCVPGNTLEPCDAGASSSVTFPTPAAIPVSGRWGLLGLVGILFGAGWLARWRPKV